MPAPEIVHRLIQQFTRNRADYVSDAYNEAQLRQEFLNPFFEVLGWDVNNKQGFAVQYREVIHEDSIEVEGSKKAPDYAFRLGGVRKFFVEAKKPAENIEYDARLAYQLRRYAWNAHLPLSILTDFEEFAVYDCRNRPDPNDSPATSRIMMIRYEDYPDHWEEIAGIFSPDAILQGAFDRYAADNTGKKGTIKVDDAFLADIESWRTLLARNIALRNPQVADERQLNFAVQMIIDRIIFLRICEDRQIERENQLRFIPLWWTCSIGRTCAITPGCSTSRTNPGRPARRTPSPRPSPWTTRCSKISSKTCTIPAPISSDRSMSSSSAGLSG